MKKIFVIDWGANCQGGRYALIKAFDMDDAFFIADELANPFRIAELKLPNRYSNCEDYPFVFFDDPKEKFRNEKTLSEVLTWNDSCALSEQAYKQIKTN